MTDKLTSDEDILALIRSAYTYAKPEMAAESARITLDSKLSDLHIQSVAALEMSGFIEEKLSIQFSDDELAMLNGISDMAALIRKHVA